MVRELESRSPAAAVEVTAVAFARAATDPVLARPKRVDHHAPTSRFSSQTHIRFLAGRPTPPPLVPIGPSCASTRVAKAANCAALRSISVLSAPEAAATVDIYICNCGARWRLKYPGLVFRREHGTETGSGRCVSEWWMDRKIDGGRAGEPDHLMRRERC